MIAQAIEKILKLSEAKQLEINGETYSTEKLHLVKKREQIEPHALVFHTLKGMVDFIQSDIDKKDNTFLHVVGHDRVSLLGAIQVDNENQRVEFAISHNSQKNFLFGQYLEIEEFIISIQSRFIESATTNDLLSVIGNLANEHIKTNVDDGLSQALQVKTGITTKSEVTIENPLSLRPYRTFREIEQPESDFIIRIKSDGNLKCALFESDGGKWCIDAIENIKSWLKAKLPEVDVIG